MNRRKWTIWLASALLIVLAVTGYFAIAAEYGSQNDPLVALSYVTDTLLPSLSAEIENLFAARKDEFDQQINTRIQGFGSELDAKVAEYKSSLASGTVSDDVIDAIADKVLAQMQAEGVTPGSSSDSAPTWQVVKIEAGKKLVGEVGCEILLRIGSATCVASGTPGLINLSAGTDLANGNALATNNLYIVTVNGRGISTSAGCTILVNGKYTIQ